MNSAEKGISVVLPVYNEEDNIEYIVQSVMNFIPNMAKNYEVIVVDDGSEDQSSNAIERLSCVFPRLKVICLPRNIGYGGALLSGFRSSKYPSVFFMDADGQFLISDLHKFVPHIDNFDIIIGKRAVRHDQLYRALVGKLYNFLICLLFKINIKDITCGFKLIKKSVLDELQLESMGGFINAEMLIKALKKGYLVKEIEVRHYPRKKGKPTGASFSSFRAKVVEMLWSWHKLRHGCFV